MRYFPNLEYVIHQVLEGKQVGMVYHFTNLKHLSMMATQTPPFVMFSRNGLFSMTRNPYLNQPPFSTSFRSLDVRIALDGDRMSDKYQIRPISGRPDDDVFDPNSIHRLTMDRSRGEAEEFVLVPETGLPILPYIVRVNILRRSNHDPGVLDTALHALEELNIPYAYEKRMQ